MKKSLYGLTALLLVFCLISACNKFGDLPGSQNGKLQASAYKVDIDQPDTLVFAGAKSTDSVKWSVIPSGFDSLITQNNKALIFFKKAGKYQVSAAAKGVAASTNITVSDSVYHPVTSYNYVQLTGDQITLVPHFYSAPLADSSYLSFVAQTQKSYCGTSRLVVADSLISNKFGINFLYVKQPTQCTLGESPIATVINFTQNLPGTLPNGTFPLSVTLNGTTYNGSIVATSTTITFNWNYTSGVLIAPKQISR
ncbi:hypothetical protein [Mucilaginibacter gotjawali]|uniref:Uncharacterized protein n=2 Tax=Mucilaginibacter gotjawali TaxID=1550579 RepID=A0A110B0B1_9SPHI|nr:hypothetical protein [Mucilaginibacter gotjawali]MBB3059175.1 hypothetical protein [Mucilaginibacter gotjawali]BAU52238.1 hypothetical protein MgSA37_00388 [Mucilaginibacter gotjawali]